MCYPKLVTSRLLTVAELFACHAIADTVSVIASFPK